MSMCIAIIVFIHKNGRKAGKIIIDRDRRKMNTFGDIQQIRSSGEKLYLVWKIGIFRP